MRRAAALRRATVASLAWLLPAAVITAQVGSPSPARDSAPAAEPTGSARLTISVVAADTGAPVRRARVTISGTAMVARPPAAAPGPSASATLLGGTPGTPARVQREGETDDRGQVTFAGLPSGYYSVMTAAPSPYVRLLRVPSASVKDGDSASLVIRLERGGAITGRILDENGEPVSRASVQALGKAPGSSRGVVPGGSCMTDDRGQFRLFDLQAGDYLVSANFLGTSAFGPSSSWEPRIGYVPTYYPGTVTIDAARTVVVRAGQDTVGVDFSLLQGRLGRVIGTALDAAGNPLPPRAGGVSLVSRISDTFSHSRSAPLMADGTFAINDVPPGDYFLVAQTQRGEGPTADREAAFVPVTVNGDEVVASVRTNRGATLSGRVVVEGSGRGMSIPGGPPMPTSAAAVRVSMRPASTGVVMFPTFSPGSTDTTARDGTFQVTGARGLVLLAAYSNVGAVKSVRRAGVDLMRTPLELAGTERIDDIEVVVSTDTGSLTGMVLDARGQPAPGIIVIVFPDDPKDWFLGSAFVHPTRSMTAEIAAAMAARMPAAAQPGGGTGAAQPGAASALGAAAIPRSPGQFLVPRLLPGRYYVAVVETEEANAGLIPQLDKEMISSLRQKATLVDVPAGEVATVTVRTSK